MDSLEVRLPTIFLVHKNMLVCQNIYVLKGAIKDYNYSSHAFHLNFSIFDTFESFVQVFKCFEYMKGL